MKRAIGDEQKNQRRDDILQRTAEFLLERDFEDVTLSEVASSLGLVKGTLYRYFPAKESLVLEILEREMALWLASVQAGVTSGATVPIPVLSLILSQSLADRPLLVRLFSIVHVLLEKKLPVARIVEFKLASARLLETGGAFLESVCPPLAGKGRDALLALYELAIGVGHLTDRPPAVTEALKHPGLTIFRLDFKTQLQKTLTWTLTGLSTGNE